MRPLVWLFIFAAGFRQVLGISIIPPYETYILYEVYIAPGLMAMIQLFNGMQSSLSMVYDREMGNMRTLLVSPLPRWYLLFCKLLAGTAVSLLQVYAFLLIAWFWDITPPPMGYLTVLPALILSGLMLGALGMLISSGIKQLENFAGVMNFVIFPMFFASSALYPLWRVQEGSPMLYYVCQFNPFTHAVELIRFALYGKMNWISLAVVGGCTAAFMIGAIFAYDPSRGLARRGPAEARHDCANCSSGSLLASRHRRSACLAADPRYPDWPCAQAKVPEISLAAVWAGPPLDDVRDEMEGRRQGQRAGGPSSRRARTPLEDAQKAITEFLTGSPEPTRRRAGKLLFAGLFDTLNAQRSLGHERAGAGDAQAARRPPTRSAPIRSPCRAAGCDTARPAQDRRARQPAGLGNANFRGPAPRGEIRLRRADHDRPAPVRARAARSSRTWSSSSRLRHIAVDFFSLRRAAPAATPPIGRLARSQPSVPSGYQATLE